ncbi:hypothetical protein HBA_0706 [Sodalis endosymbiont of Henestaris halophilus]|nr:hypothetical protein HBA_0706 [Sodalis endosymbiont of Henestaris halophilus]
MIRVLLQYAQHVSSARLNAQRTHVEGWGGVLTPQQG